MKPSWSLWAALVLGMGTAAGAAGPPAAKPRLELKPAARPGAVAPRAKGLLPEAVDQAKALRDLLQLKADPEAVPANPLLRLGNAMRDVEHRLAAADAGDQTRRIQKKIVTDLDALLQQCQQCQGGQSQQQSQSKQQRITMGQCRNPSQGAKSGPPRKGGRRGQSPAQTASKGRPEKPQLTTVHDSVRDAWGHLPQKDKEQMIQSFKEAFLPQYQDLIKQYYQTISERSVANHQP